MPSVDKVAFGATLARYRQAAGLTLAALSTQLSEALDEPVSPQVINLWEHGKNLPELGSRRATCEALETILGIPDRQLLRHAGMDVIDVANDERLASLEEQVQQIRKDLTRILALLDPGTNGGGGRRGR